MTRLKAKCAVGLTAAALTIGCFTSVSSAQSTDSSVQERIRTMQERIDEMSRELQELRRAQQAQQAQQTPPSSQAPALAKAEGKTAKESAEPLFDKFMKGFFGTLDVSTDYTTKGMSDFVAYHIDYAPGFTPTSPYAPPSAYAVGSAKGGGAPPLGRVGWLGAMSSNGSNIGYRGTHHIGKSDFDFIYQVSTSIDMAAAPGLQNTWTKSSNTVMGAIGLGDTYVGFQNKHWGKLKFGEMYMPYKTSTDRLNPFAGGYGNYSSVMGNTGGDNRVEFGTRMDHVVQYNSPTFAGFSFDLGYSFGQNVTLDNTTTPLGSPDCSGGNTPGSGNLPLNCDDGGFDDAYSADIKFETSGGLYLVAAYEMHKRVNRNSDGIGSNHPWYGYVAGLGPNDPRSAAILDWGTYCTLAGSVATVGDPGNCGGVLGPNVPGTVPGFFADGGTPPYTIDIGDEWAMKFGGQYRFAFGLTVDYLWEEMHRNIPASLMWQNERQRNGQWVALSQAFNDGGDVISIGWAHAGASVGDPGGQHNFDPRAIGNNQANMYAVSWRHKFDKQLTWYLEAAETINDANAHFDIGAGGHGIKIDCHDATHTAFIDYSSAGPTTWGGCHPIGVTTGVNYKF